MYLLDTDILIYALKGVETVVGNIRKHADAPKAISVISYGELVYGAYKSAHLTNNLAKVHHLREIFPIIDATDAVLETFGSLKADLSKKGITIDDFDLLIGATAVTHSYTVVTNNEKHFSKIPELNVANWAKD